MPLRIRLDLAPHQGKIRVASFVLLFIGFLLFLLTNLGTPIVKNIYLMSLTSSVDRNPPHTLRFGVWGACTTGTYNRTALLGDGPCTKPELGYTTPQEYFTLLGAPDTLEAAPTQGLEVLFLMHPVATALIFCVTVLTYFMNTRDMTISALLLGLLGGGAATFAFAADIAFVVVARQKVNELTPGQFKILWGNAVWMQFVGWLLVWGAIAIIFANCIFGIRKYR